VGKENINTFIFSYWVEETIKETKRMECSPKQRENWTLQVTFLLQVTEKGEKNNKKEENNNKE
jgi:hypothetical protein